MPDWSAILEIHDPDGTRTRHPFRHPRIKVGRHRDNDLALEDEGVSHAHCEFAAEDGWFVVRDLGSHNGTFLNGRRIAEAKLRDGDEVRLGGTRIRVSLDGSVRKPNRRAPWRPAGAALGIVAVALVVWQLVERDRADRAAYASAIHIDDDACDLPQFEALDEVDAQLGGRSFAITLQRGKLKLTPQDESLDRELQSLYQRKHALYEAAARALGAQQQERRDQAEKLAVAGRKLARSGPKTAAFVDALLQQRAQAVDELLQTVQQLEADTDGLTRALGDLLAANPDRGVVEALQRFRFRADLNKARALCEQKDAAARTGLSAALTTLSD